MTKCDLFHETKDSLPTKTISVMIYTSIMNVKKQHDNYNTCKKLTQFHNNII